MSLERHRLLELLLAERVIDRTAGQRILHFAPESEFFVGSRLRGRATYMTADIASGNVQCRCNLEAMPFPDHAFGALIANHVLEHVADEQRALREIRRVVAHDGIAVLSVPIVYGWDRTYEDERIEAPEERRVHFGQEDHKRIYGQDFLARVQRAEFSVEIFRADPAVEVRYGLKRGEQLFIAEPRK